MGDMKIWQNLQAKKKLFKESRVKEETDHCLNDYTNCVKREGGALLFAVIGGKMSEGSHFRICPKK